MNHYTHTLHMLFNGGDPPLQKQGTLGYQAALLVLLEQLDTDTSWTQPMHNHSAEVLHRIRGRLGPDNYVYKDLSSVLNYLVQRGPNS